MLTGLLLLLATASAEDLMPRAGAGWTGFKAGSWVRVKRTVIVKNRRVSPSVLIWTQRLLKSGKTSLTLETSTRNVVGMEQKSESVLPLKGEAGKGEKESVEKLKNESVVAGGVKYDCARRRTTVTGPSGKRVITEWTAAKPKLRVKRTEVHYDKAGKAALRLTILLVSPKEHLRVGDKTIRCVKYRTLRKVGGVEQRGEWHTSRDMPGDLVHAQEEVYEKGEATQSITTGVVGFEAR